MATVLDPVVTETPDDQQNNNDDHQECHLYVKKQTAMCGLPRKHDTHRNVHKNAGTIYWEKGMLACPVCGVPICVDCLLAANAQ